MWAKFHYGRRKLRENSQTLEPYALVTCKSVAIRSVLVAFHNQRKSYRFQKFFGAWRHLESLLWNTVRDSTLVSLLNGQTPAYKRRNEKFHEGSLSFTRKWFFCMVSFTVIPIRGICESNWALGEKSWCTYWIMAYIRFVYLQFVYSRFENQSAGTKEQEPTTDYSLKRDLTNEIIFGTKVSLKTQTRSK